VMLVQLVCRNVGRSGCSGVNGALNVIRQGHKARIKKTGKKRICFKTRKPHWCTFYKI
jgi:hypothetical protein